jgi:hypothetical protein
MKARKQPILAVWSILPANLRLNVATSSGNMPARDAEEGIGPFTEKREPTWEVR